MENSKVKTYTQEGYDKLVAELEWRKGEERDRIKDSIAVARSFGDLSENAEYDAARNEQAHNEARIRELESLIENANIIDESLIDTTVVNVGSVVLVEIVATGKQIEYTIVGTNEADPVSGKISDVCPVGIALVGKRAGDVVTAVIVRSQKGIRREDGSYIKFDDNAAVIINAEGNPKGTRIFGPVARELRANPKFMKIISLAPEVL